MRLIRPAALVALPLLVAALAGCPDREIAKVNPGQNGAITKDIPTSADIDILFVIDNSASTADKQTAFAANFINFVTALSNFPVAGGGTGLPNVHIGVVTSTVDLGVSGEQGCPHPNPTDNGLLQNTARVNGCTPPMAGARFISDIGNADGTRTKNYTGTLDQELACIAQVGDTGCGFESQLESIKRALDGTTNPQNAGFIRDGAYLAIIILTDEDDASVKDPSVFALPMSQAGPGDFRLQPLFAYLCDTPISATMGGTYTNCKVRTDSYLTDPQDYVTFLTTIKDPSQVVVGLIAGPQVPTSATDPVPQITTGSLTQNGITQTLALEPSCSATINGNPAIARPGIRLADFQTGFGDHGLFQTVCTGDYSGALTMIGQLLFNAVSPCLEGSLDTFDEDPSNPGLQLDCTVSDVVPGTGTGDASNDTITQLPTCAMTDANTPDPAGARPCWWIKSNPAACVTETGLELHIERGGSSPATGTSTQVQCATGANIDAGM